MNLKMYKLKKNENGNISDKIFVLYDFDFKKKIDKDLLSSV